MLIIKNAKSIDELETLYAFPNELDVVLDAEGRLMAIPALIDPHVHFRTPGQEHKENWISGAQAAVHGGVTTVIDMPNNTPSCITLERLLEKKKLINQQLSEAKIPLHYALYLGADQNHLDEIAKAKNEVIGIKVFMGSSTGDLLMTDDSALDQVFKIAAQENLLVSVHAEDEDIIQEKKKEYATSLDPATHSKIRDRSAAIRATSKAIDLAAKYNTRLFILHVSTKEEMELIRQAKKEGIHVYCEVTPHHLFLCDRDYAQWGTKVQMNPPIRTQEDQDSLWEAIHDGTVDTIGTDHAPHSREEKELPYGQAPSGIPGIETVLPLLLNAYHENKISLEKIIDLTHRNPKRLFGLGDTRDVVLVDLEREQLVAEDNLKTKCGWSPYAGRTLKGWPIFTLLNGHVYQVNGVGEYSPPVVANECNQV